MTDMKNGIHRHHVSKPGTISKSTAKINCFITAENENQKKHFVGSIKNVYF